MAVSPSLIAEAVGWRREFHAAPELGYQEQETSRRVAELLASFGLQVHRGLAERRRRGDAGERPRAGYRPARRYGRPADHRAGERQLPFTPRRGDARLRPRWTHRDAAGGRRPSGADPPFQRHRPLCLPAARKRTSAARAKWWRRGCSSASRWTPSTRCITGRGSLLAKWRSAMAR